MPPMPGKAIFERSSSGIPKTLVPFVVTFISLSFTQHSPSQAKAFSATLACATRAHAPCSIRFWMSFDLAPTRYDFGLREAERRFEMRLSRKFFLRLSTHTIVYLRSAVHNRDISGRRKPFLQRSVARATSAVLRAFTSSAQTKTPASLPGFCISCNRLRGWT